MDFGKAVELIKKTKEIIRSADAGKTARLKGDADFVTGVDLAVSSYMKSGLESLGGAGFYSEEEDGVLSDPCWILDPVDGTTNLIYGYNMSAVSLGYYSGGKIVFGAVYNPFTDELFAAELGGGAYLGGRRLRVSARKPEESIIEFGAGSTRKSDADINFDIAKELFKSCVDIRRICATALTLCFVASGRIDGYFEGVLKPWDIAAGSLILTEAGGQITDFGGGAAQFAKPGSIIASNGLIHDFIARAVARRRT